MLSVHGSIEILGGVTAIGGSTLGGGTTLGGVTVGGITGVASGSGLEGCKIRWGLFDLSGIGNKTFVAVSHALCGSGWGLEWGGYRVGVGEPFASNLA